MLRKPPLQPRASCFLLALLAVDLACGAPAWGDAVNGLAIGVDIGKSYGNETRVRVHFRNTGTAPIEFGVGGTTGGGSMYSVDITAIAPSGKTCKLGDTTVGSVGGYVGPIVLRLSPGATNYVSST